MKKTKFRAWLDEQPRVLLTFDKNILREGRGWSAEEFSLESRHRGIPIHYNTVISWCSGSRNSHPRSLAEMLRSKFPGIKF